MALDRDTLNQLLGTVERFVAERLRPLEERVAEEDRIPPEIVAEMRELGLFGLSIPEEYGGLGLTMAEEAQVAFRLGGTSPAFRSIIGTNNGIGSQGIVIDGTHEQKAKYLPRMASGEIIGSFCLTEPRPARTPARSRRARAATAMTIISSTARSASSPTRRRRGSSPSSRGPIRTARMRAASAPS